MGPFENTPMFSNWSGPNYVPPLNIDVYNMLGGGTTGGMAQLLGPMVLQSLMGPGKIPAQFAPSQNIYDQLVAQRYFLDSLQASQAALQADTRQAQAIGEGALRMYAGRNTLTPQEQAQARIIAQDATALLPFVEMLGGTEIADQLFGSRGSASLLGRQLFRTMYTGLDPVTGSIGASPRTAGMVATHLWEGLYSTDKYRAEMRGISAGTLGVLYDEAVRRGWSGGGIGAEGTLAERMLRAGDYLPEELDEGTTRRIAVGTTRGRELQALLDAGQTQTAEGRNVLDEFRDLDQRVTAAHQRIRAAKTDENERGRLTDLGDVGEGLLAAGEADRIKQRLSNLTGVVSAMRDIFGDLGRPNAPMRELLNGLDALTQGSMASMDPARVEQLVRTSYNLAKQSGIGMQGLLGLTAQAAGMADQLGMDRALVPGIMQGAMAFGAAARLDTGWDRPAWGRATPEQLMLQGQRLRMAGAVSPLANRWAALLRAQRDNPELFGRDTEAGSMLQALREGRETYAFRGQELNVGFRKEAAGTLRAISQDDILKLMKAGGMSGDAALAYLVDVKANQEMTRDMQLDRAAARAQQQIDYSNTVKRSTQNVIATSRELHTIAQQAPGGQQAFMTRVGDAVNKAFWQMDSTVAATPAERHRVLAETLDKAIGPGRLSQKQLTMLAGQLWSQIDVTASMQGQAESALHLYQLGNPRTRARAVQEEQRAIAVADTQQALSSLGREGMVARISDAVREGRADTSLRDLGAAALGGIDLKELAGRDPTMREFQRQLAAAEGALQMVDPKTGLMTEEGRTQAQRANKMIAALAKGGTDNTQMRETLQKERAWLLKQPDAGQKAARLQSIDKELAALDITSADGLAEHLKRLRRDAPTETERKRDELTTAIRTLEQAPQDKQTQTGLAALKAERDALDEAEAKKHEVPLAERIRSIEQRREGLAKDPQKHAQEIGQLSAEAQQLKKQQADEQAKADAVRAKEQQDKPLKMTVTGGRVHLEGNDMVIDQMMLMPSADYTTVLA
jgi:hypothetical protein